MKSTNNNTRAKECYYVLGIQMPRVVTDVTDKLLVREIHYDRLITLSHFAQYDTLREAKAARLKQGGIILKGVNP